LALHRPLRREVALKLLPATKATDPSNQIRFSREMKVMTRFRHPNLISILDGGMMGDVPYLVTEYVAGAPLDQLLARSGPMHWPLSLALTHPIACGLECLHQSDVLHRDVKPSNVLVRQD